MARFWLCHSCSAVLHINRQYALITTYWPRSNRWYPFLPRIRPRRSRHQPVIHNRVLCNRAGHKQAGTNKRDTDKRDTDNGPLTSDQQLATKAQSSYTVPLPAWAQAQQTPFDELMSQPAKVPSVPAPDVLPLQPLRPWITPPPKSESSSTIVKRTQITSEGSVALTAQTSTASPWSEENVTHDRFADDQPAKSEPTNSQSSDSRIAASSASQPAHGLSVDAWPDEHFSNGQVVSKLPLKRELQSAIVAPSDILPPKPGLESLAATPPAITRQPTMRSVTTPKIRFGQSNPTPAAPAAPGEMSFIPPANMQPLPALPESRRSHVIFQPTR